MHDQRVGGPLLLLQRGCVMATVYDEDPLFAIFYREQQLSPFDSHKDEFQGICFKNETDALDYVNALPHCGYGSARRCKAVGVLSDDYTGWKVVKVKSGFALGYGQFIELKSGRSRWLQVCQGDIHDNLSKFPDAVKYKVVREALEGRIELFGRECVDRVLDKIVETGLLIKQ